MCVTQSSTIGGFLFFSLPFLRATDTHTKKKMSFFKFESRCFSDLIERNQYLATQQQQKHFFFFTFLNVCLPTPSNVVRVVQRDDVVFTPVSIYLYIHGCLCMLLV
jgi:hypothetical protein